jgi:hypothetical protein
LNLEPSTLFREDGDRARASLKPLRMFLFYVIEELSNRLLSISGRLKKNSSSSSERGEGTCRGIFKDEGLRWLYS